MKLTYLSYTNTPNTIYISTPYANIGVYHKDTKQLYLFNLLVRDAKRLPKICNILNVSNGEQLYWAVEYANVSLNLIPTVKRYFTSMHYRQYYRLGE